MPEIQTAQSRYTRLQGERNPYLERARASARISIPHLIPYNDDHTGSEDFAQPYQSVGARGVNHLSAKLMLALFPPGHSWFRLSLPDHLLEDLALEAGGDSLEDAKGEIEAALGRIERTVLTRGEHRGHRATLTETMKHLLVAGNALLQTLDNGGLRLHPISHYVVKRDKSGDLMELVVKETVARVSLPEEARQIVEQEEGSGQPSDDPEPNVDIYTHVYRDEGKWSVYQEVRGKRIDGTDGTYPLNKTPWMPLRLIKVDGEDYGRGFVEQYLGDLRSLDAIRKALVVFTAAASKVLVFVDENGYVTMRQVEQAESGDTLPGRADDLSVFMLDKFHDFQVVKAMHDDIKNELEQVFLLFSGVQRHAERVTAEEIRAAVAELEQALGGIYSVLGQELQAPLARILLTQMVRQKEIPRLPEGSVDIEVVSGIEALGRMSDLGKIREFVAVMGEAFGPEQVAQVLRRSAFATRIATALGLTPEGLVKTDEELAQELEEQRAQELAVQAVPQATRAATQEQPPEGV
jgi:hypothetical protein